MLFATRTIKLRSSIASISILTFVMVLTVAFAVSVVRSMPIPTNIQINTPSGNLQNEEQVFICPTDSNIIIANWRDFRLGYRQIGIGRSTDGGLTWTDSLISYDMQYVGIINGLPLPIVSRQSDPTMTVDRLGNFYMSVLDYSPTAPATDDTSFITFYKSTDKGVSWTGPVPHITQPGPFFEDKQFITVDRTGGPHDGNVYMAWMRFPNPNTTMFVRSIDGAASFEDTLILGPEQTSTSCGGGVWDAGQFPNLCVAPNGDVHVFWMGTRIDSTICSGFRSVKHVVSTDGGQTFTYEDNILDVSGYTFAASGWINAYSQPAVDADITGGPFDGNLYLCFTNIGDEDLGVSDIDFMRSTDNALTWSPRLQINDAFGSSFNDSFHPWLVVNDEGIIVVIFYDTRISSTTSFDLYAAYSFDGGETFTTNDRITNVSSFPWDLNSTSITRIGPNPTYKGSKPITEAPLEGIQAGRIGEYICVTTFHDKVNAVWTDSRDGNSEVYTANWYLSLTDAHLVSPDSNSIFPPLTPVELRWSTSWKNYEDRYRVEVSLLDDFSVIMESQVLDTNFYQPALTLNGGTLFWRVKAFNLISGDSSVYSETWSYEFGDISDKFTELFDADDNDLSFNTLTLTPDGSAAFYTACEGPASEFPTDPTGGVALLLSDDGSTSFLLSGGETVSLYGLSYDRIYVSSNGYLTFGGGSTAANETLESHFGPLPHVSGLYDDLNPHIAFGGTLSWIQLSDRVAVTFENVPEFNAGNSNSFQIEMFFDGTITITHLNIDATDGLVGISDGSGYRNGYPESNLDSDYIDCTCCLLAGDANNNGAFNIGDAVFIITRVFSEGPQPPCCEQADSNGNGAVNIADGILIINTIFNSGPAPICGVPQMTCD